MKNQLSQYKNMSQKALDIELLENCKFGYLENVTYLLTSPELETHADIHAENGQPIITACLYGNLEIAKFLLTSPLLEKHADLHMSDNLLFKTASVQGRKELLEFMINEMNLEKTEEIKDYLKSWPDPYSESLFLSKELKKELLSNPNNNKSLKI